MRRSAIIAVLLGCTALTPTKVEAGPVLGFVLGATGIGAGTALGATAAFSAGAAFAGTFFGGLLVKTVLSVGLSLLAASLQPKPDVPPPSARMVNFAQPISYAEWVFGRTRKGGPLGFSEFQNNRRYYVPILAAHSIEGVVEHWLDEVQVTLNSETDQSLSNIASGTNPSGYVRINPFLGQAGQVVDPGLDAAFTEITSAHDFKGLSGAVLWAKRPPQASFSDIYPSGRQPNYVPVFDADNQIYDPRDESTGWSNNAALLIAHWLVNKLNKSVDWSEVAIEADVCDELVTNAESETQARWTANGSLSDNMEFEDQRAQIAAACDAFLYEKADGKVGFKVGRWEEPTVTLTADDFLSVEITEGNWGASAPTEVAAIYTEPENGWRETSSGAWVEDETGRTIRDEPALYLITNHNQVARMNKRIARTKRAQYRLRGTLSMVGYELLEQRFVRVILPEMGIYEYFEIGELAREGVAAFTLAANSVTEDDFDPDIEEPTRPKLTAISGSNTVSAPASLSGSASENGTILFAWPDQDPSLTQEIRYRDTTETDWQSVVVAEGADVQVVTGFGNDVTVEAQIRNVTAALRESDWAPATPIEVTTVIDSTPPDALAAFAATKSGDDADLDFTAPNDGRYVGTRIYRGTTATFASATLIHTEYGVANAIDSHTDVAPGYATFYYWGAPINASGVEGTASGPQSLTFPVPGP